MNIHYYIYDDIGYLNKCPKICMNIKKMNIFLNIQFLNIQLFVHFFRIAMNIQDIHEYS